MLGYLNLSVLITLVSVFLTCSNKSYVQIPCLQLRFGCSFYSNIKATSKYWHKKTFKLLLLSFLCDWLFRIWHHFLKDTFQLLCKHTHLHSVVFYHRSQWVFNKFESLDCKIVGEWTHAKYCTHITEKKGQIHEETEYTKTKPFSLYTEFLHK